jgi:hypothetical protein
VKPSFMKDRLDIGLKLEIGRESCIAKVK